MFVLCKGAQGIYCCARSILNIYLLKVDLVYVWVDSIRLYMLRYCSIHLCWCGQLGLDLQPLLSSWQWLGHLLSLACSKGFMDPTWMHQNLRTLKQQNILSSYFFALVSNIWLLSFWHSDPGQLEEQLLEKST